MFLFDVVSKNIKLYLFPIFGGRMLVREIRDDTNGNGVERYNLMYSHNDLRFVWTDVGGKVLGIDEQEELFIRYDRRLKETYDYFHTSNRTSFRKSEIWEAIDPGRYRVKEWFRKSKKITELGRRAKIPLKLVDETLAIFLPVVERWRFSGEIAEDLGVSGALIRNYTRNKLIESRNFGKCNLISPLGERQLINFMYNGECMEEPPHKRGWVSLIQLANELGISQSLVRQYRNEGKINSVVYADKIWVSPDAKEVLKNSVAKLQTD